MDDAAEYKLRDAEAHLKRYVAEAAFEWNHRVALDVDNTNRATAALRGIGGKRLTCRPAREATRT